MWRRYRDFHGKKGLEVVMPMKELLADMGRDDTPATRKALFALMKGFYRAQKVTWSVDKKTDVLTVWLTPAIVDRIQQCQEIPMPHTPPEPEPDSGRRLKVLVEVDADDEGAAADTLMHACELVRSGIMRASHDGYNLRVFESAG